MSPPDGALSLDAAVALIPVLLDEVRALRREVGEVRARLAATDDSWKSPTAAAREMDVSLDTITRRIASGELESVELGRKPLMGKDGHPLLDKNGQPRFRRLLRVRVPRPASIADLRAVAAEMVGTASPGRGGRRERSPAVNGAQRSVGAPWPAEPAEAGH